MRDSLIILNGANQVHVAFGEAAGAEKLLIEERVKKRQFAPLKAFRLLKNSLSVPGDYRNILCESCYYYPAIKRRLLGLKSRIININCGPLIYNIHSGRLKGAEGRVLRSLLKEVDAHLVFGSYGMELIEKIDSGKPTGIVYPYIGEDRYDALLSMKPRLDGKEMTLIGNDDISCKGIDIAVKAFNRALESDKELRLNIVTNIPEDGVLSLDGRQSGQIKVLNGVKDIKEVLARTSLYLHPSRGDTFPRASLEAMLAGVPVIVSEETGTKELVEKADGEMLCRLDDNDLAGRIVDYFGLSSKERQKRSKKMRELAKPFNKEEQLERFRKEFQKLKVR